MVTYSTRNGLILPAQGEYIDTWGTTFNAGQTQLVDQALDGVEAITVSGTVVLTTTNGASNQARKRVLVLTGTGGQITIPDVEKWYFIRNGTTGAVIVKPTSTGFTVPAGMHAVVYCDGTTASLVRLGGWGEIAADSTAVWTLNRSNYSEFAIHLNAYSHNSGGNANLTFSVKESGSFTNFNTLIGTVAASEPVDGVLRLFFPPGESEGVAVGNFVKSGANAVIAATNTNWFVGSSANPEITVVWSAGSVDAGSIKCFAKP